MIFSSFTGAGFLFFCSWLFFCFLFCVCACVCWKRKSSMLCSSLSTERLVRHDRCLVPVPFVVHLETDNMSPLLLLVHWSSWVVVHPMPLLCIPPLLPIVCAAPCEPDQALGQLRPEQAVKWSYLSWTSLQSTCWLNPTLRHCMCSGLL